MALAVSQSPLSIAPQMPTMSLGKMQGQQGEDAHAAQQARREDLRVAAGHQFKVAVPADEAQHRLLVDDVLRAVLVAPQVGDLGKEPPR